MIPDAHPVRAQRAGGRCSLNQIRTKIPARSKPTGINKNFKFNTDEAGFPHNILLSPTTPDYIRGHPRLLHLINQFLSFGFVFFVVQKTIDMRPANQHKTN
ncbi:MAG TPA: hypothetical protein DDZ90_15045 [Planctomycetaceae bacterium]|nr:hypothetical protein [Gimesia sp.]HBL44701.1 hypothetical protein [Planctomycetaceae bacterium]